MASSSLKKMCWNRGKKEGNYASSDTSLCCRSLNYDLGLTLSPGSQIQQQVEFGTKIAPGDNISDSASRKLKVSDQTSVSSTLEEDGKIKETVLLANGARFAGHTVSDLPVLSRCLSLCSELEPASRMPDILSGCGRDPRTVKFSSEEPPSVKEKLGRTSMPVPYRAQKSHQRKRRNITTLMPNQRQNSATAEPIKDFTNAPVIACSSQPSAGQRVLVWPPQHVVPVPDPAPQNTARDPDTHVGQTYADYHNPTEQILRKTLSVEDACEHHAPTGHDGRSSGGDNCDDQLIQPSKQFNAKSHPSSFDLDTLVSHSSAYHLPTAYHQPQHKRRKVDRAKRSVKTSWTSHFPVIPRKSRSVTCQATFTGLTSKQISRFCPDHQQTQFGNAFSSLSDCIKTPLHISAEASPNQPQNPSLLLDESDHSEYTCSLRHHISWAGSNFLLCLHSMHFLPSVDFPHSTGLTALPTPPNEKQSFSPYRSSSSQFSIQHKCTAGDHVGISMDPPFSIPPTTDGLELHHNPRYTSNILHSVNPSDNVTLLAHEHASHRVPEYRDHENNAGYQFQSDNIPGDVEVAHNHICQLLRTQECPPSEQQDSHALQDELPAHQQAFHYQSPTRSSYSEGEIRGYKLLQQSHRTLIHKYDRLHNSTTSTIRQLHDTIENQKQHCAKLQQAGSILQNEYKTLKKKNKEFIEKVRKYAGTPRPSEAIANDILQNQSPAAACKPFSNVVNTDGFQPTPSTESTLCGAHSTSPTGFGQRTTHTNQDLPGELGQPTFAELAVTHGDVSFRGTLKSACPTCQIKSTIPPLPYAATHLATDHRHDVADQSINAPSERITIDLTGDSSFPLIPSPQEPSFRTALPLFPHDRDLPDQVPFSQDIQGRWLQDQQDRGQPSQELPPDYQPLKSRCIDDADPNATTRKRLGDSIAVWYDGTNPCKPTSETGQQFGLPSAKRFTSPARIRSQLLSSESQAPPLENRSSRNLTLKAPKKGKEILNPSEARRRKRERQKVYKKTHADKKKREILREQEIPGASCSSSSPMRSMRGDWTVVKEQKRQPDAHDESSRITQQVQRQRAPQGELPQDRTRTPQTTVERNGPASATDDLDYLFEDDDADTSMDADCELEDVDHTNATASASSASTINAITQDILTFATSTFTSNADNEQYGDDLGTQLEMALAASNEEEVERTSITVGATPTVGTTVSNITIDPKGDYYDSDRESQWSVAS